MDMDRDHPGGAGGAAFDCSWRKLAYSYAPQLQAVTATKAKELFDALELKAMCNETFDPKASRPLTVAPHVQVPAANAVIYVSNKGSDSNEGTSTKEPVETLHGALFRARKLECRKAKGKERCDVSILLRAGTCS